MSVKAVIGHDATQIWVVCEEDTEEIVYLPLVPIRTVIEACDRWYGCGLVCVCLDPDSSVVADGEHVVDDLEALVACWVVDRGDVGDHSEFGGRVVFEEGKGRDDAGRRDVYRELVFPHREPANGSIAVQQARSVISRTAEHIWEDMRSNTGRMRGGIGSSPGACLGGVSKTIPCAVRIFTGKPTGRIDNGCV